MATLFRISLYAPSKKDADAAAVAAFQRINALEDTMSDYDPRSELTSLSGKGTTPTRVSEDLFRILHTAEKISRASDGAFDVTIGPFVQLWRTSKKKKVLPSDGEIAEARLAVGWQKLRLNPQKQEVTLLAPGMKLDLGGIAKGFAADEALHVLRQHNIDRAMVAASGDIAVGNPPPGQKGWRIAMSALEPGTNRSSKILVLRNCGISTSGDTEQFVEIQGARYSHIVDAKTGLGLTNRIQATVIAPNAALSDSVATAVCALGTERGLALADSLPETAALIKTRVGDAERVFVSRRFKKKD